MSVSEVTVRRVEAFLARRTADVATVAGVLGLSRKQASYAVALLRQAGSARRIPSKAKVRLYEGTGVAYDPHGETRIPPGALPTWALAWWEILRDGPPFDPGIVSRIPTPIERPAKRSLARRRMRLRQAAEALGFEVSVGTNEILVATPRLMLNAVEAYLDRLDEEGVDD